MPLLGLSCARIDGHLAGRDQVCPTGKQPNDDQSECVQCPVGQATTTGACAACIPGWVPVSNVAGDEQARCEVRLILAPSLLSFQAMSHTSPWSHVCIDGRLLGVSRYVQLASSRTTTRATVCSALWAKPLPWGPAVHVALARLQTMIRPAAFCAILGSNRSMIMTCALNALQGWPLQYRTLESASSAPQARSHRMNPQDVTCVDRASNPQWITRCAKTVLLEPQQQATRVFAFSVSVVKFPSKVVQGVKSAPQEQKKGRAEQSV
jgi:hypothetical protein